MFSCVFCCCAEFSSILSTPAVTQYLWTLDHSLVHSIVCSSGSIHIQLLAVCVPHIPRVCRHLFLFAYDYIRHGKGPLCWMNFQNTVLTQGTTFSLSAFLCSLILKHSLKDQKFGVVFTLQVNRDFCLSSIFTCVCLRYNWEATAVRLKCEQSTVWMMQMHRKRHDVTRKCLRKYICVGRVCEFEVCSPCSCHRENSPVSLSVLFQ